jgi:hypothetical protein
MRSFGLQFNEKNLLITTGAVAGVIAIGGVYVKMDRIREYVCVTGYSHFLELFSSKIFRDYRKDFAGCVALERSMVDNLPVNHSHAVSAMMRRKANKIVSLFCAKLGYTEFSVSRSRADKIGNRPLLIAKDFAMHAESPKALGVLKFIDVDYYLDFSHYIDRLPLVLYTFTPRFVAGVTADACYTFKGNEVNMRVNGGANYVHELWDYETDHLVFDYWWGSKICLVERHLLSNDRSLVLINPIRNIYGPWAWFVPGNRLRRRQVNFGGVLHSKTLVGGSVKHSFSREGDYTSVEISDDAVVTAYLRFKAALKPNMGDVERVLAACGVEKPHVAAALVFTAFSNDEFCRKMGTVKVLSNMPRTSGYQTLFPLVLEDGDDTMRQISRPLFQDGVTPVRSYNNDRSCIQGRVLDMVNKTTVPSDAIDLSMEFVNHCLKNVEGTLIPYDFDYMLNKWKRPSQKRMLNAVSMFLYAGRAVVKSFQKAESYGKITHPRNISTLPPDHNVRLGQFSYALSDGLFKKCHWYGFGHHPSEVCATVHGKCAGRQFVIPSDVSRMDGSTGAFNEFCCQILVQRAFHDKYCDEVVALCKAEENIKAVTKQGVKYKPQNNTLSGSSRTSWRNTFLNAKMTYVALRRSGRTAHQAWLDLGIYAGDDGLTWDLNPDVLVRTFKDFGLTLKAEVVTRGKPVPFLGRYFLDPWICVDTIADVPRQLRKLHLTSTPKDVPEDVVMLRRAEAYLVTDSATPVLSDWARAVVRIVGHQSNKWDNLIARDLPYWIKYGDPFPPTELKGLANEVVADMLGGHLDVIALQARFSSAKTLEDLFSIPICEKPPKVEVNVAYQGNLLKAISKNSAVIKNVKKKIVATTPKSNVASTKCRYAEKGKTCPRADCKFSH